ncbi:uncharacterized protein [Ptychodera flava]|uniref:uncharacterized protein n=1 Tax=Ptychodera flava TaxID=63121 RepID=UPI00396A5352
MCRPVTAYREKSEVKMRYLLLIAFVLVSSVGAEYPPHLHPPNLPQRPHPPHCRRDDDSVLRGRCNTCLMCTVKRITGGIDNMACTHEVVCPPGMRQALRETESQTPNATVSGYLTTSEFIDKTKSFLIFSIQDETFDNNTNIDLGELTGLERVDCVRCVTDLFFSSGWALVRCTPLDECPEQLSNGVRFKPPNTEVETDVLVQYCYYTREGSNTDKFLCRDNYVYIHPE